MKRFLILLYLRIAQNRNRRIQLPTEKTRDYFNLSMYEFSNLINKMEYKKDPLNGLWDYIDSPDQFFEEKESGRDCDDWSRLWSLWGVYHGYRAYEYVICNPTTLKTTFSTLHCVTVLEKNGLYYLMNYRPYGPYNSLEKTLNSLKAWKEYSENNLIVFDREILI